MRYGPTSLPAPRIGVVAMAPSWRLRPTIPVAAGSAPGCNRGRLGHRRLDPVEPREVRAVQARDRRPEPEALGAPRRPRRARRRRGGARPARAPRASGGPPPRASPSSRSSESDSQRCHAPLGTHAERMVLVRHRLEGGVGVRPDRVEAGPRARSGASRRAPSGDVAEEAERHLAEARAPGVHGEGAADLGRSVLHQRRGRRTRPRGRGCAGNERNPQSITGSTG